MIQRSLEPELPDTLRLLTEGDKAAFEQIFRLHYTELCRYSLKYVRVKEVAEEVVQDLFVQLWENREALAVQNSLRSYLFTATRNRSLNYLKSRYANLRSASEDETLELEASHSNPETEWQQQELEQVLASGIEQLPEKCRLIFQLSRHDGLSYSEIATELNVAPKTVENQMAIALKKLRSFVLQHWGEFLPLWLALFLIK